MAVSAGGLYNDAEHSRLPNSLPVVGRSLAEQIIEERGLERPQPWGGRCYPGDGWPRPGYETHKYVRALFAVLNSGGTRSVVVVCGRCGHGRQSISFAALTKHDILPTEVPLLADLRRDYCERCGALGAQLHHMAPRRFFEDADGWPTAYLCQTCHAEWHRRMGTSERVGSR